MKSELVLQTSRKAGFLKRDICILSFFKDEILITTVNNKKQQELLLAKKNEEKERGGGFIKQTFAMQTALTDYYDSIQKMNLEEIKKEETEIIKKSSISKIKYKRAKKIEDYESGNTSIKNGHIIIYVGDSKKKFSHSYIDKDKDVDKYLGKYV